MAQKMLKAVTMSAIMLAFTLVTSVASANAQAPRKVTANVPFDFQVGNKSLPAGKYEILPVGNFKEVLRINSTEDATTILRLANSVTRTNKVGTGKLIFHRYGDAYFLSEIWRAGDRQGYQLRKSSREKQLQQQLAMNPDAQRSERIEVALVRD